MTVCKVSKGIVQSQNDPVSRGKRSIAIDLKSKSGIDVLKQIANKADVFIEPFRPGVAEKVTPCATHLHHLLLRDPTRVLGSLASARRFSAAPTPG